MKTKIAVAALLAGMAVAAQAALVEYNWTWAGDLGYTAQGSMTYDNSYATYTYSEGSLASDNAVEDMTISFYDPESTLLGSFAQITSGETIYDQYLTFTFDVASQTIAAYNDYMDMGKDDSNEGEYYMYWEPEGSELWDVGNNSVLDTNFNVIPEPATFAFVGIFGAGALAVRRIFMM